MLNKRMASLKQRFKKGHQASQRKQEVQRFSLMDDSFHNVSLRDTRKKNEIKNKRRSIQEQRKQNINPQNVLRSAHKRKTTEKSPDLNSTKKNNKNIQVNKSVYEKACEEREEGIRVKRLKNDLIENSLELFKLGEQNLLKRKQILDGLKQQLNLSWKKLCQILSGSSDGSIEIVESAIKTLVSQRKFIQEQKARMKQIIQTLKL